MKKTFAILFILLTLVHSFAATVSINVADILGQPTSATLTFSPRSTPGVYNPSLIISGDKSVTTGTNGLGSIVLVPGDYMLKITGRPLDNRMVAVGTNSTYALIDIITNALVYTQTVSPTYVLKSDFVNAGDLLTKHTNGQITNLVVGTHGYYLVADTNSPYKIGWTNAVGGSGTVTSIGITSSDLDVTGSPVTTSGNITLNIKASVLATYATAAALATTSNNLTTVSNNVTSLSNSISSTYATAANLTIVSNNVNTLSNSLGTAAYSNSAVFASAANLTTVSNNVNTLSNSLGTAAYSNSAVFASAANLTTVSNTATANTANITVVSNNVNSLSNALGSAAFVASSTFQPASANLTNFSLLTTGQLASAANLVTVSNNVNTLSNALGSAAFVASSTFQPASANLSNWANVTTGSVIYGVAAGTGVTTSTNGGVVTVNASSSGSIFINPAMAGGRLTLVSGQPVVTTNATNSIIYYEPYNGNALALLSSSGTAWATNFPSLSLNLTNIGGVGAGTNIDFFVGTNSAGTLVLTNTLWSSDTARAVAISQTNGVWTISTNIIWRYVGTARTDTTNKIVQTFGGFGNNGVPIKLFVFNANNTQPTSIQNGDTTDSWTFNSTAWKMSNNSSSNRISCVVGLPSYVRVSAQDMFQGTSTVGPLVGIGVNVTNAASGIVGAAQNAVIQVGAISTLRTNISSGFWFFQQLERQQANSGTVTAYGDNGSIAAQVHGMTIELDL